MMTIPYIAPSQGADYDKLLDALHREKIAENNWPEQFPYTPEVSFAAMHDGERLYVKWYVGEQSVRALESVDGNKVCTDSCVELFIRPSGDDHYYNFEFNAAGTLYLARRTGRHDPTVAPDAVFASIERYPSLGSATFEERCGDVEWSLLVVIPISALFGNNFTSWSGLKAGMNLYKCGDALSVPHYISWAPIAITTPDFHRPEYFAEVLFE